MIYGIGCDLCSTARMAKSLGGAHGPAFAARVFGPSEREALGLTGSIPDPLSAHKSASAAADFAAKEAFLKAAGTGLAAAFRPLRDRGRPAGKRRSGIPLFGRQRTVDGRTRPAGQSLPESRRRHGAGVLHSGNGNLNLPPAYNESKLSPRA